MNYYALQVKTRKEEKFMKLLKALHPEIPFPFFFPQRSLDIRRKGVIHNSRSAIFPGYVFIEVENDEELRKHQWDFRRTDGFYRFLPSNQNICPLADKELELVLHFIKRVGPLAGKSLVTFDINSRIVVIEGPLAGLEGKIVKVDKRKGRAKVKLDIYEDSFSIDLAFETLYRK